MPIDDEALLTASLHDPPRFTAIFDRHARDVHRFLALRIGESADDLLSETFLTAFRRRSDYRSTGSGVRAWIFGIAANLVRDHKRAENRRYRALARIPDERPHHDHHLDRLHAQALGGDLAAALAQIKALDREALLLLAWADLSYSEIADVTGVPIGTVRSRIHRARTTLKHHLKDIVDPIEDES